jgi:hypothetical protein
MGSGLLRGHAGRPARALRLFDGTLKEEKTRNGILSTLRTAKLAPIGYPDRYSIEQARSDQITFCSKTGFDPKAPVTCDRSPLGWEHIISF